MVSVKSTVVIDTVGVGATTLAADFDAALDAALDEVLGATSTGAGAFTFAASVFGASGLMALLEITNRRRNGAALAGLTAWGALAGLSLRRLLGDALFGVVTLRFNINIQTGKYRFSSEKLILHPLKKGF